jgi:hypothetical protein
MAIAAELIGLYFGARADVVDSAAHVADVFPCEAAAGNDVHAKEVVFEISSAEIAYGGVEGMIAFSEASGIGAEDDIAFAGKCDAGLVHFSKVRRTDSCRFILAYIVLAGMLVPDTDSWGGVCGSGLIGNEQPCSDAFTGFHEIGDAFASVAIFLIGGFEFGVQWSMIRPRTAETFEELFAEGIRWG